MREDTRNQNPGQNPSNKTGQQGSQQGSFKQGQSTPKQGQTGQNIPKQGQTGFGNKPASDLDRDLNKRASDRPHDSSKKY